MSFRPGLSSSLFRPITFRTAQSHLPQLSRRTFTTARSTAPRNARLSLSPVLFPLALGSSYAAYHMLNNPAACESSPSLTNTFSSAPRPEVGGGNPPPHSDLSAYQLGFGAVCGICTGVFVKKGLRAIAFLLGGVFVLMQVGRREYGL
jgi:FUN14 domain-containing protein 1